MQAAIQVFCAMLWAIVYIVTGEVWTLVISNVWLAVLTLSWMEDE